MLRRCEYFLLGCNVRIIYRKYIFIANNLAAGCKIRYDRIIRKAFSEVSKLPSAMQNLIAQKLLKDIEAEEKWDETFAETQDELSQLADEALEDFKKGKTKPIEEIL